MKKRYTIAATAAAITLGLSITANAALIGVTGPKSDINPGPDALVGPDAAILATPPSDLLNGQRANFGQEGFDEAQNVLLTADLGVDGGTLSAGTWVSSHMIFLNADPEARKIYHLDVEWEFDGAILGVMSDNFGELEAASTSFLGNASVNYPTAPGGKIFNDRGLESNDSYSILGNVLTVSMKVTQPGDWIRVVTAAKAPVPEPATMLLFGAGLAGLAGTRLRRKK